MQDHRKLKVWQRAHANAISVRAASDLFPNKGYASLRTQITSAAESIPFNIAEGCGTRTAKAFVRYLDIAVSSTSELEAELELAKDYSILPSAEWQRLAGENEEIRKMLCGLRRRVIGSL